MVKYKSRWISLTLAAAILMATLLPFFATYGHAAAPSKLASLFGEKVLICTGEGFAWVKWSDLQTGKAPVKPHKDFLCPLCYTAASSHAKMLLPAGVAMAPPAETPGFTFSSLDEPARKAIFRSGIYSRAPPFSFFL